MWRQVACALHSCRGCPGGRDLWQLSRERRWEPQKSQDAVVDILTSRASRVREHERGAVVDILFYITKKPSEASGRATAVRNRCKV